MINNPFSVCEDCKLYKYTPKPRIPGKGNFVDPKVCGIGEAPGPEEAQSGEIFIGRAGKRLDKMVGEDHKYVYWTNCVKCFPPKDIIDFKKGFRAPTEFEIECCSVFLKKELLNLPKNLLY